MARRKTKSVETVLTNPTPLFDEVRYNRIMDEINAGLDRLSSIQVEIMAMRAEARVKYDAENRKREAQDKKDIAAAAKVRLVIPKPKTRKKGSRSRGA